MATVPSITAPAPAPAGAGVASAGPVLIFGGSGRCGQLLCREAAQRGLQVLAPTHAECPLEDAAAVSDLVLGSGAQAVFNCAAVSGLEACAEDALYAHLVNAVAPAAMALACRHTGARFVHLSTDYVLDGRRNGKKAEETRCRPGCVYAETKREGELQVAEAYAESVIARVSWVCGNPDKPSFIESTLRRAAAGEKLAAVADKYSMPTDAADIARAVLALAASPYRGIIHLCSSGQPMSWWDCAAAALAESARSGCLPAGLLPEKQELDAVPFFREKRPRYTAMDNARLLALGIAMPTAEETVAAVTRRFWAAKNA